MRIRPYSPSDYPQLVNLYHQSELYGGQFDPHRDAPERIDANPGSTLVAEHDGVIVGTVSIIEDGRVAWLFRFAVAHPDAAEPLCSAALQMLKQKGHTQVLVYTPVGNSNLDQRYDQLGFTRGATYTCFWKDIAP